MGFHSGFVYDHFHPIWNPKKATILEDWILLSALAVDTSKIRIGTLVNCNSYRYPSVLAKMASSLDVISRGRLEFMIGAGWYEAEYRGYGIPFPSAKVRIEQMKEAIQVIKLMWTEDEANFRGKYYTLDRAICYPKPLQKPYPRIWVGGGGEKFTLRAVAEVGEGTNLFGAPKDFERKLKILGDYCEKIGRDYDSIGKSWTGDLVIGKDEGEINRELEKLKARLRSQGVREELSLEQLEGPRLIGTPSQVISKIEEYLKLGIDYFVILPTDLRDISVMKLFSEKVMPSFK